MSAQTPPTAPQVAGALLLDASQRRKLLGYARSRFGIGAEDAEDLLQDTLLQLLRQRDRVTAPDGFVFTIFRLGCSRYLAACNAAEAVFAPESESAESAPQTQASGPERMERRITLRQALGGISSTCRRLLCAFYIEGRSLRDTADTLSVAQSGVSKTINRCLRRLRECMS
jgi:RNA polymerase sigma factor (sigma-70 family)